MWRRVLILLLLPTGEALAFKPAQPVRHDMFSPNGKFVLDVDPQAKRFRVFAADKRDQPLWSINRPIWLEKHFRSDDGKVVAIVSWEFVQTGRLDDGVCVQFWNRAGMLKRYGFADLCPHPA